MQWWNTFLFILQIIWETLLNNRMAYYKNPLKTFLLHKKAYDVHIALKLHRLMKLTSTTLLQS